MVNYFNYVIWVGNGTNKCITVLKQEIIFEQEAISLLQ